MGRLDLDSEGLLLLTNDGAWAQHLLHPKHEVEKDVSRLRIRTGGRRGGRLAAVTDLEGESIRPARVEVLRETPGTAVLAVTIHEGEEPAGPPDVCPVRPDGEAAAPGPGGSSGAGRSAAGKVAVFDTGRGRGAGSHPLTESGRRRPEWGGVFSIPAARRKKSRKAV